MMNTIPGNYYAQQPYGGMMMGQPMQFNATANVPNLQGSLTPEEINALKSSLPTGKLDLTIAPNEDIAASCNHVANGVSHVSQIGDGSGDVYCDICHDRWNPNIPSDEELNTAINTIISSMQTSKWVGNLPIDIVREYYKIIPFLRKFPKVMEYAMRNFKGFLEANNYQNDGDISLYNQYNTLMGGGYPYNQMMMGGYQQPTMMQQQMPVGNMYPQQNMGMVQQPAMQPASTMNPMYQPNMNMQFANQNQMMMNGWQQQGGMVQQPNVQQAQATPYTPGVNNAQQTAVTPAYNPVTTPAAVDAPKADAATATTV